MLTCHNFDLSAAKSCNTDCQEKVEVGAELKVNVKRIEMVAKKRMCVCTYMCVIHLFNIQMPLL